MYKPSQRRIRVDVLAVTGWVSGTIHVPLKTSLLAAFNRESSFLALTQVTTDPSAPPMPFLAIRRDAIVLVIPEPDDLDRGGHSPGSFDDASIRCYLQTGFVEGIAAIRHGLRVSDFLETNPGFIVLAECHVATQEDATEDRLPRVILNTRHVLAVSETGVREERELALSSTGSITR